MAKQRYERGHLTKTTGKPAKWQGEWHIYRIVDGKEKRIHRGPRVLGLVSRMTKAEAQKALDDLILEERKSSDQKPAGETNFEWLAKRYMELKRPTWSRSWADCMAWLLKHHILPALGKTPLSELKRTQIQTLLNELAVKQWKDRYGNERDGLSFSLIHKTRTYIKAILDEAVEDDLIPKNPAAKLDLPKTKDRARRALSQEECDKLFAAVHGRDYLMLRILLVCGLRKGELFALRRNDVLPGTLHIDEAIWKGKAGRPKNKASMAPVSLPPNLEAEIRAWLAANPSDGTDWLFPSPVKPGSPLDGCTFLRSILKPAAARAGIEGVVNFQTLRRTCATHFQRFGTMKDAQAQLRHASPDMTANVYTQVLPDSLKAAAEKMGDVMVKGRVN